MFIRFRKNSGKAGMHDLSDHDLILKYQKTEDPEVIAALFQRYTHLVYGVSLKYLGDIDDAKDAVLEIFEQLMNDLLKHDIHNFKSWLHSVTRNHCLMILRKKKTVRMEMEALNEKIEGEFMESPEDLHQTDILEQFSPEDVNLAMGMLKEPQRRCIELVYLKGKSYNEVSEQTGYSLKVVKSHVQNGKRNLRIILESQHVRKQ